MSRKSFIDRIKGQKNNCLNNAAKILNEIEQTDKQTDKQTDLPNDSSVSLPNDSSVSLPNDEVTQLPVFLGQNEYILASVIKKIDGNPTNLSMIAKALKKSHNTLKYNLKNLIKKNLIEEYNGTVFVGPQRCFVALIKLPFETSRTLNKKELDLFSIPVKKLCLQTIKRIPLNSSSKNPTTKEQFDLLRSCDPEMAYWNKKSLTKKQLQLWLTIANCNEITMLRYLSYCRFEMVDLGLEKNKPIDNVLNWFYKILEKTGGYPKPKGYKSFEEKRLEEKRTIIAEQEQIAKEQEELYRREVNAKQDAEFFKMLNNPDSEMYQKCFDQLNAFTKKRVGKKSFEASMRSNFDRLIEEK